MNRYLSEFIGTFFIVLTVGLAGSYANSFAAWACAGAVIALTYLGLKTSGAHYNPAISLAMFIRKKLTGKDLGLYTLAQLAGGFAAAGLVILLVLDDRYVFQMTPGRGDFPFEAIGIELLFSFLITLVYLVTTQSRLLRGNDFYGLAIGLAYLAAWFVGGPISGGSFNPATAMPANIIAMEFGTLWIYGIGPLAGGALAAYASRVYLD